MSSIQSSASAQSPYLNTTRALRFESVQRGERTFDAALLESRTETLAKRDTFSLSAEAKKAERSAPERPIPANSDPYQSLSPEDTVRKSRAFKTAQPADSGPLAELRHFAAQGTEPEVPATQGNDGTSQPAENTVYTLDDLQGLLLAFNSQDGDDNYNAEHDLNGDGSVGITDLLGMLRTLDTSAELREVKGFTKADLDNVMERYGSTAGDDAYDQKYDLDGDGTIGMSDLLDVLADFEETTDLDRLMNAFGSTRTDTGFLAEFDYNNDGSIDVSDLLSHLKNM